MSERESILSFLMFPTIWGYYLLAIAMAFLILPSLFRSDIKIMTPFFEFTIPLSDPQTRKGLRIVGAIFSVFAIILLVPICSLARPFQDFESDNGTSGNDSIEDYCRSILFAECDFASDNLHTGQRSIRVTANKHPQPNETGGTVRIFPSSPTPDLSQVKDISVWVFDTQGNNTIELKLCNGDNCPDKSWSPKESTRNAWTQITWPMSNFLNVDKHAISAIELYVWNDGVYYFDDVEWHQAKKQ